MFNFLSNKFSSIFASIAGKNKLTPARVDETLGEVEQALLEADVSYAIVRELMENIRADVVGKKVFASLNPGEHLIKVVHDRLFAIMGGATATVSVSFQIPSVVMVMGLQGSGKTTTIAKIAHFIQKQALLKSKKRDVLIASVDFYRPAAIDQLEILAGQVGVAFYRSSQSDPVGAAKDIYAQFKRGQYEHLILDTAGRLHVDDRMIDELRQIDKYLSPKHKILILDAMTGQESLEVARSFEEKIGFNAAILTKMDSETRAGAAIAFRYVLNKPIMLIGTGEKHDDIEQFHPDRITKRMLGMGDLQTLLERAEEKIQAVDSEKVAKAFDSNSFTFEDFAQQMSMVDKIGSLSKIMQYLPGMGSLNITPQMLEDGETKLKKLRAIIGSMTPKERREPKILDASRKKRIAYGSGTDVDSINALLKQFEESKQFVKLLKKNGRFSRLGL
jgi:signal recognition particle subunit SRP54